MPNPYHAGSDEEVRIVFDLANASKETRISVYAAAGELVWQTAPASRAARQGHSVAWDGRNAAGKRVAAGMYYLVLEADGQIATRTLAVLPD